MSTQGFSTANNSRSAPTITLPVATDTSIVDFLASRCTRGSALHLAATQMISEMGGVAGSTLGSPALTKQLQHGFNDELLKSVISVFSSEVFATPHTAEDAVALKLTTYRLIFNKILSMAGKAITPKADAEMAEFIRADFLLKAHDLVSLNRLLQDGNESTPAISQLEVVCRGIRKHFLDADQFSRAMVTAAEKLYTAQLEGGKDHFIDAGERAAAGHGFLLSRSNLDQIYSAVSPHKATLEQRTSMLHLARAIVNEVSARAFGSLLPITAAPTAANTDANHLQSESVPSISPSARRVLVELCPHFANVIPHFYVTNAAPNATFQEIARNLPETFGIALEKALGVVEVLPNEIAPVGALLDSALSLNRYRSAKMGENVRRAKARGFGLNDLVPTVEKTISDGDGYSQKLAEVITEFRQKYSTTTT